MDDTLELGELVEALVGPWDQVAEGAYNQLVAR
jgi:hypothetical protein